MELKERDAATATFVRNGVGCKPPAKSQGGLWDLPQYGPPYLAAQDPLGAVLPAQEKGCEDFQRSLPAYDSIYGNIPSWRVQHREHHTREEE